MLQSNWQPPSHSFYHVHVFSDIELWCFSFVTLFNLQGTRPARLSGGTFAILTHSRSFVKYFFRLFQIFFRARFSISRPSNSLLILPELARFVKPFFRFLGNFFSSPSIAPSSLTACLIYQIIPHLSTTFSSFFKFFWISSAFAFSARVQEHNLHGFPHDSGFTWLLFPIYYII